MNKDLKKITKPQARKLYDEGKTIILCPCKLSPYFLDGANTIDINKEELKENDNLTETEAEFNNLINAFTYYNCNASSGQYPHFYIKDI